jgi:hypothetical protein
MLAVLVSIALSQATTPTGAVPTTVTPQGQVEVVAPEQPRRICRLERDTSTRISARRICQTVREREQEREQAQRTTEETVNRNWDRYWGCRPLNEMQQQSLNAYRSNGSPQ